MGGGVGGGLETRHPAQKGCHPSQLVRSGWMLPSPKTELVFSRNPKETPPQTVGPASWAPRVCWATPQRNGLAFLLASKIKPSKNPSCHPTNAPPPRPISNKPPTPPFWRATSWGVTPSNVVAPQAHQEAADAQRHGQQRADGAQAFPPRCFLLWTKSCTLKPEAIVCWYLQGNHHSRVSSLLQEFIHAQHESLWRQGTKLIFRSVPFF